MSKIPLFNPLKDDFAYPLRNDANEQILYIVPAREVAYFEVPVHDRMKKHLAEAIYNVRGDVKRDHDLEMADIYKEIEVSDELG